MKLLVVTAEEDAVTKVVEKANITQAAALKKATQPGRTQRQVVEKATQLVISSFED